MATREQAVYSAVHEAFMDGRVRVRKYLLASGLSSSEPSVGDILYDAMNKTLAAAVRALKTPLRKQAVAKDWRGTKRPKQSVVRRAGNKKRSNADA
jgi:hypothetical protein